MPRAVLMRGTPDWDPQFTRMVGVSAAAHAALLVLVLFVLPFITPAPLPIVAYTVELTDPSSLGGKLPVGRPDQPIGPRPGPAASGDTQARQGEPVAPPPSEAKAPEPPKPPEPQKAPEPPKPPEPEVKLPSVEKPPPPKPEAKPPEPKPEPKADAAKPEPPKPAPAKPQTASAPKPADAKPADAKPADAKPAGKPNGKADATAADGGDAYAAAAEKWRAKGASGGGGGLGGTDTSGGPIGTPGYGPGGGGQVVGLEFLAYQQRVVSTVKAAWVNVVTRPGLVAKVRFQIGANGEVSGVKLEQASGDAAYDASVQRAVQRSNPLPPPPARYVNDFREFVIEFKSEEEGGGQGQG